MWEGIKTQFWDLVDFLKNPLETARNLRDLAVGLFADFEGTMQALKDAFKEEFDRVASGDPRQLGQVIGENLSPAPLAAALNRIRGLSKFAAAAKKADSGCSSFLAGTLVWTPEGMTAIESLAVGDTVHTRSDTDYTDHLNPISALMRREAPGHYEIEVGNELVKVTSEHPFWRQGSGWTEAKDLQPGDPVAAAAGDVVVLSSRYVKGPVSVYNFSVERNHNYFVSPHKLWVHNQTKPCSIEERATFTKEKVDAMLAKLPAEKRQRLGELLDSDSKLKNAFVDSPDLVDAWNAFDDAGIDNLAGDLSQLEKFDRLAKRDGLDAEYLGEVLGAAKRKGYEWENPENILDAVERVADSGIDGLDISHMRFSRSRDETFSYVRENARKYQAEGSGDADLSFNLNGVSFDDVNDAGQLVDRKWGHADAVFNKDGTVKNEARKNSILEQAKRQLAAAGGDPSKIKWEISTELGARGIEELFKEEKISIQVEWVPQQEIKY